MINLVLCKIIDLIHLIILMHNKYSKVSFNRIHLKMIYSIKCLILILMALTQWVVVARNRLLKQLMVKQEK